jgi:hypothetical protein
MWRTDGTLPGTTKVDIAAGEQGAFESTLDTRIFETDSWMYFFGISAHGSGLHRTDGTVEGTSMVYPLTISGLFNDTGAVYRFGDQLLFEIEAGPDSTLRVTNGTQAGTILLTNSFAFTPFGVIDGKLYFENAGAIWSTDATPADERNWRHHAANHEDRARGFSRER